MFYHPIHLSLTIFFPLFLIIWQNKGGEKIIAVAYDYPIPGFNTANTINIRLWSSKPNKEFDLVSFNEGNYDKSVEEQKAAENITSVLVREI